MKTTYRFLSSPLPRLLPLLALLGMLVPEARAAADTNFNTELAELAKDVKQFLDGKSETAISVGQFIGPNELPSSSGPAIALALADELKKVGVDVKLQGCNFTIKGEYKLVEDGNSKEGLHAVAIESTIVNKRGAKVLGPGQLKPRGLYGDAAKAMLFGLTFSLPPAGDPKTRDQEVEHAYTKPKAFLDKTRIKAGDSPYSVEILVKQGDKYVPRAAVDKDGLAFVDLKKDEVYRVRVYNDSDYEGTTALYIDGLGMFQFSELRDSKNKDKPLYDRMLVAAHGSYDVPGWHRNNDKNCYYEFKVTKYADSEAAQLYPDGTNFGTITLTFAAAWPKDGAPPADEPMMPTLPHILPADQEKGNSQVSERRFGVLRAAISVRYSK